MEQQREELSFRRTPRRGVLFGAWRNGLKRREIRRLLDFGGAYGDRYAKTADMIKKNFDCVAMKDGIQRRLLKRMGNLTCEQRRSAIRDTLEESRSPIGALWRALAKGDCGRVGCIAEGGVKYDCRADSDCASRRS